MGIVNDKLVWRFNIGQTDTAENPIVHSVRAWRCNMALSGHWDKRGAKATSMAQSMCPNKGPIFLDGMQGLGIQLLVSITSDMFVQ